MKCHGSSSIAVVLLLLSGVVYGQADAHKHGASAAAAPKSTVQKSEAQKSFAILKSLAGEWEGPIETDFPGAKEALGGKGLHVTMRVTSRGNVLVHEFQEAGTLLDPAKYDHPVTMLYVDNDQMSLVHYCDAGNRPRMTGKIEPDGKTVSFDFAELSGSNKYGHMHQATFTVIDENHHTEEWLFMLKGKDGKEVPVHAKFDLKRVKGPIAGAASGGAQ